MKTLFLCLGLISVITVMSFTKDNTSQSETFNCREMEKSVVKITDKLYAGKFEVTNLLYREFTHDLTVKNKTDLLKKVQVDSLNWRDKLAFNEPMVELYFRHPAFANYPVVNISHEAAVLFCEWLTNEYNSNPGRKFKKIIFRLPAEAEWELAAKGGLENCNYSWGDRLYQDNRANCNYMSIGDENLKYDTLTKKVIVVGTGNSRVAGSLNDKADITAPVDSYKANKYGLYNVCGNVAEMIQEKGIAKGGSWRSPGGDVTITSVSKYTKSGTDLGFRYFMEIIEE